MQDKKDRLLSEINMVPFVDIVLVLLIIFMISAPLMYRGIDVDLPRSSVNTIKQEQRIMLIVDRFSNIYVDDRKVPMEGIESAIRQKGSEGADVTVYLKADTSVPYGTIIRVMDKVKGMGIDKLGMVTESLKEVE
ncbi:MAG TPA: biopolymer transporter ExbD [Nitrospirota bacterium]|nr:biopolymer transporter ExbD [Nitrospirota bacterium]